MGEALVASASEQGQKWVGGWSLKSKDCPERAVAPPAVVPAAHECVRPGCFKPTWNGNANEYCRRSCQFFNLGAQWVACRCCVDRRCERPDCLRRKADHKGAKYCGRWCRDKKD